tara:strand:+ start:97 stop:363 length:267 start_codon:yes stop_codon:yes gene_type:complete
MVSKIQAVLFPIKHWDATKARNKLRSMGLKAIKKVDKTENYLRYRILEPNYNIYNYRIKKSKDPKKLDFIIQYPKKKPKGKYKINFSK